MTHMMIEERRGKEGEGGRESGVEREISASLPCSLCIGETDHNRELLD